MSNLKMVNSMYMLGQTIQKSKQDIFESCGSDMDKYRYWLRQSRWEFYEYLEMLNESLKKVEASSK